MKFGKKKWGNSETIFERHLKSVRKYEQCTNIQSSCRIHNLGIQAVSPDTYAECLTSRQTIQTVKQNVWTLKS